MRGGGASRGLAGLGGGAKRRFDRATAAFGAFEDSRTLTKGHDAMNDDDPRRQLDQFTDALVEKLRFETEITLKRLISPDKDIALMQLGNLHERALHRLKNLDFETDTWWAAGNPDALSEDQIAKIISIVIATLGDTLKNVREHVIDCDRSIYGEGDEGDVTE
ncbi:hypothetical protein [uncultured Methylobacterium sp.]|uniref:hypothetical protein n=1 Tax=uncultured Methylobacterium sp. TaxID=157278 RepID=UPI0035CC9429